MKRSLVLSVCCLLLAMAAPVCADIVPCISTVTVGNITIDATWDQGWGTLGGFGVDKVDIYLTGITGAEAAHLVQSISGLLQTSTQFYVWNKAGSVSAFKSHTTINPDLGSLYYEGYSVVNFGGTLPLAFTRQAGTDATNWSNIIGGSWYNNLDTTQNLVPAAVGAGDDNDGDTVPENLILSLLVKTGPVGQTVSFGDGTSASQFGFSVTGAVVTEQFSVTKVPEPSTLALLGCGLFGLLAYAWRKRK
jgi:hypothetical protein